MSKNEENKKSSIIIWSVGIGALLLVVFGVTFASSKKGEQNSSQKQNNSQAVQTDMKINSSDHVKGNKDAKVALIEYADYQCPACGTYYPLVKQIGLDYKDSVVLVSRNFPLKSLHKNGENSARAAEAANKQGKFWEMHDLLFERQKEWSDRDDVLKLFTQYAGELKLDTKQFTSDFSSKEVQQKIDLDAKSGTDAHIQGTPTFFLNGKKIEAPRSYEDFRQVIEDELAQVQK